MATPFPTVVRIVSDEDGDIKFVIGEMKRLLRQRGIPAMILSERVFKEVRFCTIWRQDTGKLIAWTVLRRDVGKRSRRILRANGIIYDQRLPESELVTCLAEFMQSIGMKIRTLKSQSQHFFYQAQECVIDMQDVNETILYSLPALSGTRKADTWVITL